MKEKVFLDKFIQATEKAGAKQYIERSLKGFSTNLMQGKDRGHEFFIEDGHVITKIDGWLQHFFPENKRQKIGKRNIAIIGESSARGFGLGEKYCMANLLRSEKLEHSILDLSQVSLPATDIYKYKGLLNELNPDKLIIMVGNNLPLFPFQTLSVFHELKSKKLMNIEDWMELFKSYVFRPMIEKFVTGLDISKENIHFIVPIANLEEWWDEELNNSDSPIFDFRPNSTDTTPGLGENFAKAFEQSLEEFGISFTSLGSVLKGKEDFLDYCHFSLKGAAKVHRAVCEYLNTKSTFDFTTDKDRFVDSSLMMRLMRNRPYSRDDLERYPHIKNLFDGTPLIFNNSYHECLSDPRLTTMLAGGDPKRNLPIIVENLRPLTGEFELLGENVWQSAKKVENWVTGSSRYLFVNEERVLFKFLLEESTKAKIQFRLLVPEQTNNITVSFNDVELTQSLSDKNVLEVQAQKGMNTLLIETPYYYKFPE
ncbi:MAG: hypothetical protein KC478_16670, partial [Bacteriovoracaceae bacterium]|nr:hypothetical protein [Bacteriovoracaceae bacterium]